MTSPKLQAEEWIDPTPPLRVDDLKEYTVTPGPHPFLRCPGCGDRWSAERGDYFRAPGNMVLKCGACGLNMERVIEAITYKPARP